MEERRLALGYMVDSRLASGRLRIDTMETRPPRTEDNCPESKPQGLETELRVVMGRVQASREAE